MSSPKLLVLALSALALSLCFSPQAQAQAPTRTVDLHAKEIYELQSTPNDFIYFYVKVSDIITATADVKSKCVDKTDSSLLIVQVSSNTKFFLSHVLAAYLNKKQIFVAMSISSTTTGVPCAIRLFSTR